VVVFVYGFFFIQLIDRTTECIDQPTEVGGLLQMDGMSGGGHQRELSPRQADSHFTRNLTIFFIQFPGQQQDWQIKRGQARM
jgi:hypothetical protein